MSRLSDMALRLLPLPEKLLIGLSGGADSVALTHLLMQLRRQGKVQLWAVHVNHGLRGGASDGDEVFVRDMCAALQLPLLVYRAAPPEHPGEDWARQARYGFYRDAVRQTGAQAVALAHHRDDQAETLLLHLLRGAGLNGLSGMAQDSQVLGVRVVRPLLEVSRQELRDMLTEASIPWREDASNQDSRYLRNALRNEVMPLLERLAPGAGARMARAAGLLREDADSLAAQEEAFLKAHSGGCWLALAPLQALDSGLRKRVLRRWWAQQGRSLDEYGLNLQQTEAFAALIDAPAGSRCNLPGSWHGYRGWTHMHLLSPECGGNVFDIMLEMDEAATGHGDGKHQQAVPRGMLKDCSLRTRQPGDWIIPFGSKGRQSLQDYFVNRRIDAPFRDSVPLLCRGSEVLLAAGIGAGDIPPQDDTQEMVSLRWRGDMPWCR